MVRKGKYSLFLFTFVQKYFCFIGSFRAFGSKVSKSANVILYFFPQNIKMGIKNEKQYADLEKNST